MYNFDKRLELHLETYGFSRFEKTLLPDKIKKGWMQIFWINSFLTNLCTSFLSGFAKEPPFLFISVTIFLVLLKLDMEVFKLVILANSRCNSLSSWN